MTNPVCIKSRLVEGMAMVFGLLLGFLGLQFYSQRFVIDLEEAGFSDGTTTVVSTRHDLHFHMTDPVHLNSVCEWIRQNDREDVVLWLGNSQLHAINQYVEGQFNAPSILFDSLEKENRSLVTISLPNANLQEHLICLVSALRMELQPDLVVLPIVFDDTREDNIRGSVAEWSNSIQVRSNDPCESESGSLRFMSRSSDAGKSTSKEKKQPTTQDSCEEFLDSVLAQRFRVWEKRGEIRGNLFYQLYLLRNRVFGITPSSVRRKIVSRYAKNLEAFRAMINFSHCRGFKVLVYVPP